jgi:hypothetical protein
MAILSGSNDYKKANFNINDNFVGVCQLYNNLKMQIDSKDGLAPFLIRANVEQFDYQINPRDLLARTFVIYNEIAQELNPKKFQSLDSVCKEITGLSIKELLWLSFGCYAITRRNISFKATNLEIKNSKSEVLTEIFSLSKINKFLEFIGADYQKIRELDFEMNADLNVDFTRTRFNPLLKYPIIEIQDKRWKNHYINANMISYMRKAFNGLFWFFDEYFEKIKEDENQGGNYFRNYFGEVFQVYVGMVLKAVYGQEIKPEFKYGVKFKNKGGDFTDWWLVRDDKLYLFEIKASQMSFKNRQTCDIEKIKKEEVPKIMKPIKQLFKISKAIKSNNYEELVKFKEIKIIPIAVFYDMPFIAKKSFYLEYLKEALAKLEKEKPKYKGIYNFKVRMLNIEELELFESIKEKIELEKVFEENDKNDSENFITTMGKINGNNRLGSDFLQEAYDRFFSKGVDWKLEE